MFKLIDKYKNWSLYEKVILWIAALTLISGITFGILQKGESINNINSSDSINVIGNKNVINKTDISDPKCEVGSYNQTFENNIWLTKFSLNIASQVPTNKLRLRVTEPTIINIEWESNQNPLFEISQKPSGEGWREIYIEKPIPPYRIEVLTKNKPDITNSEFIKCGVE